MYLGICSALIRPELTPISWEIFTFLDISLLYSLVFLVLYSNFVGLIYANVKMYQWYEKLTSYGEWTPQLLSKWDVAMHAGENKVM